MRMRSRGRAAPLQSGGGRAGTLSSTKFLAHCRASEGSSEQLSSMNGWTIDLRCVIRVASSPASFAFLGQSQMVMAAPSAPPNACG